MNFITSWHLYSWKCVKMVERMMTVRKNVFGYTILILLSYMTASAQSGKQEWVDSVFQTLNENEKIGQLFFTRFSSNVDDAVIKNFEKKVGSGDFGGIVFAAGTPVRQALITNRMQSEARVPLLIAQDPTILRDSVVSFPSPLAQGAIMNDTMVYNIALQSGRQLKALGVHMSLSPNATPVHSALSRAPYLFGDNPTRVAEKSLFHLRGLQDAGILSCAKYFPLKSIEVIDMLGQSSITLYHDTLVSRPYKLLFQNGLNAIIPDAKDLALYFEPKKSDLQKKLSPESLAQFQTGDLLHGPIGFDGFVIMELRLLEHTSDKFSPGDAGLFAFEAGADLMIIDDDPDPAIRKIRRLIHAEEGYGARLDNKVRKILELKYDAGLSKKQEVDITLLRHELNSPKHQVVKANALRKSITVLRNQTETLPISVIENKEFVCVITGDSTERADIFHNAVKKYVRADRITIREGVQVVDLSRHDVVLVALFPETSMETFQNLMGALQELAAHQEVVVADFGCPVFERYVNRFPTIVTGYSDDRDLIGMIPQAIFGGLPADGLLPVAYGGLPSGTSVVTEDLQRLEYSFPEDAGVDSQTLDRIAQIANEAISAGSTPGCYVLVAKDGKVIYDRAFGHLTYEQKAPVTAETIYDLASLTKVSATLQAVMFLQEHNLIDIHKKLSVYLPELKGTNKKDITIVDILTHQAGLAPFVPLWPLTLEGPALKPIYYSSQRNVSYPLQIAPKLFGSPILKDSVWSWIANSKMMDKPVRTPYPYRYSDLGFMMFKQLAERTLNQPMEDFLQQNFYDPLGAYSLGYTPLDRFPAELIAPTELDTLFRGGLLIGTVHDERAAMLGGVSGHAGLFGTANDLSKLGQMLLQEGFYGGVRYYKPETVRFFTAKYYESSRRGLGWDKPAQSEWNSPTSRYASPSTFGHTGFTGTCLWVDPEFNLVYIFLSNRVFPDRSDKLIQKNIRSRIQDVVYEAMFNYCKTEEGGE